MEAPWAKQVELNQIGQEAPAPPLSPSHFFGDYTLGKAEDAAEKTRWSGSTAHEEECGRTEVRKRHGRIKSLTTLGALLDGVVEERVYFSIEDLPKDGKCADVAFHGAMMEKVGVAI